MKKEFEDYIKRSMEIRHLSMPPEENGQNAADFYQLFNENFGKIKVLLGDNRKFLDSEVFRFLKNSEQLNLEYAEELKDFADELADTHTLKMVDLRLAWVIFRELCTYFQNLYLANCDGEGNSAAKIEDSYIFCLHRVVTVGYNVIQSYDKGHGTDVLTNSYRNTILEAENRLKAFRCDTEQFSRLSVPSKQKVLESALFRGTAYECFYYDENMVRNQIASYEDYLALLSNPKIRETLPTMDWDFEIFSANTYLALVSEYLYWSKVPEDILLRLKKAAEEALAYAQKNPENFLQNVETLDGAMHTIRGYLGEIPIPEMLEYYEKWMRSADGTCYDWMAMENNLIPVIYTMWLCREQPEWTSVCQNFLRQAQKWTFDYISSARDQGAYDCMQRFISYIMDAYIELEDGISFRKYYENILVVTQPTLYVHCRMVARIALCILDELYEQNANLLLYANGCETMEQVHTRFPKTREFLFNCCMFHDAGKLYFLDTINMFGRALFSEEFDLIRLHPQMGFELLNKRDSTRDYAEAALYHHLWYDEKGGYPRECTYLGNDNAILYHIITCADCLDAATDSVGRAYSSGKNFDDMLADLRCNAGRIFNPDLVRLFDSERLQEKVRNLITAEREQLYLKVFEKNVKLIL